MITLLLLIPVLGSIILLPIEDNSIKNQLKMKQIALTTSLINFVISLFIWFQFDSNTTQYQFVSEFNQLNYCHLNFGIDGISIYFVLLTTFITPIALLSNYTNINKNLKSFLKKFFILSLFKIAIITPSIVIDAPILNFEFFIIKLNLIFNVFLDIG